MFTELSPGRTANGETSYSITKKVPFSPIGQIDQDIIDQVFNFSYAMSFARIGEHRRTRTGGTMYRKMGEVFSDAFQGKLAECVLYSYLKSGGIEHLTHPDFSVHGYGVWDSVDLQAEGKTISIKSTKAFGNLLLLETGDWNENGEYIPNCKAYDFTVLVRLRPFCSDILKNRRMLYSDSVSEETLYGIISSERWEYDIPGFVTLSDLIDVIRRNRILPQNSLLNGTVRMDAENYYIQAGDMRDISTLFRLLNG